MNFAKSERAELCDLLDQVGPDAPTLCGDWTTHDLAAHLWIRETDPLGAPGIVAKPLAGLTERRMAESKARWPYAELVDRIRRGPARLSVFAFPGVDEEANTVEYFVHHEDVRRAGETLPAPRSLSAEVEDWMWRRMKLMGRALFRRVSVGVVLERAAVEGAPAGDAGAETIRVMPGSEIVTLVGQPSELMLYAYGRGPQSQVRAVGDEASVQKLSDSDLGI
ncbi:TIGR03085 family protein [Naumannella sp. ID2617S]|uniref:TIGR03085 family protein n=1 Tax=Enemella dayhoffiae TaxID=2016507 RepID=A0A255GU72_9ACTN|nr:TIGR03085 family metal-binding protein [Enemella dayhoffiae]NNG19012.1 TIGR03085 family protein [Naumannella sp. ID2617S]OYO19257.1 TIGR03085 family protein [Enemella dayhoffiae]